MKGINCIKCGQPFNRLSWLSLVKTCPRCLKPRQKTQATGRKLKRVKLVRYSPRHHSNRAKPSDCFAPGYTSENPTIRSRKKIKLTYWQREAIRLQRIEKKYSHVEDDHAKLYREHNTAIAARRKARRRDN